MIVTFYSFKGGVGRSMALANVAELLAQRGYRVIVCDWDLEAPGLERYLDDQPDGVANLLDKPGVIDLITEYKDSLAHPMKTGGDEPPPGFKKVDDCLLREPQAWAVPLARDTRQTTGSLRFLPAGRRGGEWKSRYERAVTEMDWTDFYEKWSGGSYLEFFRQDLNAAADIVLIDSRTGVTELGGICTHQLADMVFVCTATNDQNVEGTLRMIDSLSRPQVLDYRRGRPLCLLPVASRVDTRSQVEEAQKFKRRFHQAFDAVADRHLGDGNGATFLELSLIPYVGLYSYVERLVARQPPESRDLDLSKPYLVITEAIIKWGQAQAGLPLVQVSTDSAARFEVGVIAREREYVQPSVPRGEFYLAWPGADLARPGAERGRAAAFTDRLRHAGLSVWCEALPGSGGGENPSLVNRLDAIERSAGYLLLVPPEPDPAWLEAEANAMLALWAVRGDYRLLVINLGPPFPSHLPIARIPSISGINNPDMGSFAAGIVNAVGSSRAVLHESPDSPELQSLSSPGAEHGRYLLGRDAALRALLTQVESVMNAGTFACVVLGDWGTGKSSLMRAGLVAALRRGLITRQSRTVRAAYVWLEDTADPAWEAVTAVAGMAGAAWPDQGPDNVDELLRSLERSSQPMLLILDNAERLTHQKRPEERAEFTQLLTRHEQLAERTKFTALMDRLRIASGGRLTLVLSERTPEWKNLEPVIPREWGSVKAWQLPAFDAAGIRQFLVGGAKLTGVTWEPDALERALADALRFQATPRIMGHLLQATLTQREGPMITFKSYVQRGGVEQVIARDAEKTLANLAGKALESAKEIILRLVPMSPRPNRALTFTDVLELSGESGQQPGDNLELAAAVNVLSDRGILATTSALLTLRTARIAEVEPVKTWLEQAAATVATTARLEQAVADWLEGGRADDATARGEALKAFRGVKLLRSDERTFLRQSERVSRNKRLRFFGAIFGCIVGTCALLLAIFQYSTAVAQKGEAARRELQISELKSKLEESDTTIKILRDMARLPEQKTPLPADPESQSVPEANTQATGTRVSDKSPTPAPDTPTPAPTSGQVAVTPSPGPAVAPTPPPFYTEGLKIEYFSKREDGSKVAGVLRGLGVEFSQPAPIASGIATNVLTYGSPVDRRDVILLARALVQAGVKITEIHAIRGSKQSKPLIQLSSYYNAQKARVYTDQELLTGQFRAENPKAAAVEVGVIVHDQSQAALLKPALDLLSGENYKLGSAEVETPINMVTETVVRYFAESDLEQAKHILSVVQSAGVRDGRPSYVLPPQAAGSRPGSFEIWLSADAFGSRARD